MQVVSPSSAVRSAAYVDLTIPILRRLQAMFAIELKFPQIINFIGLTK